MTLGAALAMQGGAAKPRPDPTRRGQLSDEVAQALIAGQRVMLTYLDAANKRSQRSITPMLVRRIGGAMTLVAQCHLRDERRTFKLNRIIAAVPMTEDIEIEIPNIDQPVPAAAPEPVPEAPATDRRSLQQAFDDGTLFSANTLPL